MERCRHGSLLGVICLAVVMTIAWSSAVSAAMDAFVIKRMVICSDVQNREPVGVADTFSADTEKVYCFIEATDVAESTGVSLVWYLEGKEMARVGLKLGQGARWRTYASKTLYAMTGSWRVELQDANNNVLQSVAFTVQ